MIIVQTSRVDQRIVEIEASINAIVSEVTGRRDDNVPQHNIATPLPDNDPWQQRRNDPWSATRQTTSPAVQASTNLLDLDSRPQVAAVQTSPFGQLPTAAAAGQQLPANMYMPDRTGSNPAHVTNAAPPMPQSFVLNSGMDPRIFNNPQSQAAYTSRVAQMHEDPSPFGAETTPQARVRFQSPTMDHRHNPQYAQPPVGPCWGGPNPMGAAIPEDFVAPPHRPSPAMSMEICRKKNDSLKKFSGTVGEFQIWRDRIVDHVARDNHRWRGLLETLQTWQTPITVEWL